MWMINEIPELKFTYNDITKEFGDLTNSQTDPNKKSLL
jgi:hypothetical protein